MNTQQKFNEMQEQPTKRKFKTTEKAKAIELYKTGLYSYKEIAIKVNVRPNTVSDWIRKYKASALNFKSEINKLVKALNIELEKNTINSKAVYCIANAMKTLKNLQD